MSKLLNKKLEKFWHDTKKWHFGIAPDPYQKKLWDYEELSRIEIIQELAKARAENIINSQNIEILNNAIIELSKEIKKFKFKK